MQTITAFVLLFTFWLILSGKTDAFHLILGVISTTIVTIWSKDLLFADKNWTLKHRLKFTLKFIPYFLWLHWQILLSNIHVVTLALHPNMKELINPQMVKFKTKLKGDEFAQYFLANSITLTPGTITVSVKNDDFLVHALTDECAEGCPGEMETKVAELVS